MLRPTTRSYAGRQLDIEMLKHVEHMLRKQRVLPDVHDDPRIVAGIEKAVQRYAKLFLTNIGSVKLDGEVGSEILRKVKTGQVSNLAYLGHLASLANLHALLAIEKDDVDTDTFGEMPDDERIVSTTIVDLELNRATSTVRVHVLITTAAGNDFTFVIPVASGVS